MDRFSTPGPGFCIIEELTTAIKLLEKYQSIATIVKVLWRLVITGTVH